MNTLMSEIQTSVMVGKSIKSDQLKWDTFIENTKSAMKDMPDDKTYLIDRLREMGWMISSNFIPPEIYTQQWDDAIKNQFTPKTFELLEYTTVDKFKKLSGGNSFGDSCDYYEFDCLTLPITTTSIDYAKNKLMEMGFCHVVFHGKDSPYKTNHANKLTFRLE